MAGAYLKIRGEKANGASPSVRFVGRTRVGLFYNVGEPMTLFQRGGAFRNALLILAFGVLMVVPGGAADPKVKVLEDSDYPKLLKREVKGIQTALKDGKPNGENAAEKARTAAILIAAAAQQNLEGADGQERATVRDAALKVAESIKAGKYDEALKLADTLPTLKAAAAAKKEKVAIEVPFAHLMHQFRPLGEGGWGIYGHLTKLQTKMDPILPRAEINENFILEAAQVAVTADLALSNVPKDKPKEFTTNLENMRAGAIELVEALKDKDAVKVAPAALSKLTTACIGCHKSFRPQ
jgi:cytochrome c556